MFNIYHYCTLLKVILFFPFGPFSLSSDFQNFLRTQTGNTTTVNIIISTVDYLLRLQVKYYPPPSLPICFVCSVCLYCPVLHVDLFNIRNPSVISTGTTLGKTSWMRLASGTSPKPWLWPSRFSTLSLSTYR